MSTTTMNGKPQRKQLGDQLDRLDAIIDLLAEGLPGAVADACREGARQAMKDVILEVLSSPELRAMIALPPPMPAPPMPVPAPVPPAPPEPKPSMWSKLKAKIAIAKEAITGVTSKAKYAVTMKFNAAKDTITAIGNASGEAVPVRRILLVTLGVGVVAGVGCLVVPQTMAAVVGAVGVATTTLSIQAARWLRSAARRVGLVT